MDPVSRIKNGMKMGLIKPSQNMEFDFFRRRITDNIIHSCGWYMTKSPDTSIPEEKGSRLPHHNLYLVFYHVLEASCLILQFSFAGLMTGDREYKKKALEWMEAIIKWDISDWSFYSSARMMIALAFAEDWLNEDVDEELQKNIHRFLYDLCKKHESEIMTINANLYTGCHPALYVSGFGVASILLDSEYEEAEHWLKMCIDIFTGAMLPREISPDGTYNGINWALAYSQISKLQFMDCLKNIKNLDLYKAHCKDITRCVPYLRQAYIGPDRITKRDYYEPDTNLFTGGAQLNGFSALYLKFASLTEDPMLQWIAMRDENAGEIERLYVKVKKGTEAILNYGPFTYLWYDPDVKADKDNAQNRDTYFNDGEIVLSDHVKNNEKYLISIEGRSKFGITEQSMNLNFYSNGMPMLQKIVTKQSIPIQECNAPAVGGEYLRYGRILSHQECEKYSKTIIDCVLATQEIICYKEDGFRAEVKVSQKEADVLRYSPEGNFDPDNGRLKIIFKIRRPYDDYRIPKILFSTGLYYYGSYGSCINLGFLGERTFGVSIKDTKGVPFNLYHPQEISDDWFGKWHEVILEWKGFNSENIKPEIGLIIDGSDKKLGYPEKRFDFNMPNTPLWFGMSVQEADTYADAKFKAIEITNGNKLLYRNSFTGSKDADFAVGDNRQGLDGKLEYWLHPHRIIKACHDQILIANAEETMSVNSIKSDMIFEIDVLKPEKGGFAGPALELLREQKDSIRLKLKNKDISDIYFAVSSKSD